MENLNYKIISWDNANQNLNLGGGWNVSSLDKIDKLPPDCIKSCKEICNWESLSDLEILNYINLDKYSNSFFYIITDLSYSDDFGVFEVLSDDMIRFMTSYFDKYEECFFNGDVIMINIKYQEIIVFQHSGFWMTFNIPLPEIK